MDYESLNEDEKDRVDGFPALSAVPSVTLGQAGFTNSQEIKLQFQENSEGFVVKDWDVGPAFGVAPLYLDLQASDPDGIDDWLVATASKDGQFSTPTSLYDLETGEPILSLPGVYRVQPLIDGVPDGNPVEIVVLNSPNNVVTPDLDEPSQSDPSFTVITEGISFTGGGSLPSNYGSFIDVDTTSENFDHASSPPTFVGLFMLQHTYAASMDIDLSPKVRLPSSEETAPMSYLADKFIPASIAEGDADWSIDTVSLSNTLVYSVGGINLPLGFDNVSNGEAEAGFPHDLGWRLEDHDYTVPAQTWFFDVNDSTNVWDANDRDIASDTGVLPPGDAFFHTFEEGVSGSKALRHLDYQDFYVNGNFEAGDTLTDSYQMTCRFGANIIDVSSLSGAVAFAISPDVSSSPVSTSQAKADQKSISASVIPGSSNRALSLTLNPFIFSNLLPETE